MNKQLNLETLAIHAGQEPDPATGAVITPIYQTSTYAQQGVGGHKGYEYSRTGNPTRAALETCIAALEGRGAGSTAYGLAFSSGMATTDMVLKLVKPGQQVVASDDAYGGTMRLFNQVLADYGIQFTFVDMTDLEAVEAAAGENTRLVWVETPTNPLLKVVDIAAVVQIARRKSPDALVAVDNTFASPALQQPLCLGADIVVHSTTKYLGGHSDVVGGALVTTHQPAYERLKFLQNAVGAVPGPMDSWLTLRGIKTLGLRMERHSQNGQAVAGWLAQHPAVERVIYPGLADHPGHAVAARQMKSFGGMISFLHRGGAQAAREMVARTRLFTLAESLGGVESLIELPAAMTHLSTASSKYAVPQNLIRLSVGIEAVEDLLEDLDQALG